MSSWSSSVSSVSLLIPASDDTWCVIDISMLHPLGPRTPTVFLLVIIQRFLASGNVKHSRPIREFDFIVAGVLTLTVVFLQRDHRTVSAVRPRPLWSRSLACLFVVTKYHVQSRGSCSTANQKSSTLNRGLCETVMSKKN